MRPEAEDIAISHASLEQVRANALGQRLRRFNASVVGEYAVEPVSLDALGTKGELLGGLRGVLALGWLVLELLWVEPRQRRHGVGSALLQAAESLAHGRGARNAWLNAPAWHDLEFLRARGYAEFAGIPDYVQAHGLVFFRKALDAAPLPVAHAAQAVRIDTAGTEDHERALYAQLRDFNIGVTGPTRVEALRLAAGRRDGAVVGGLNGDLIRGWLKINVLVVDQAARHAGVGSRLMEMADRFAAAVGARGIWLETFDWQAPLFYRARGFRQFGRIENYVAGQGLTFLRRDL